MECLSSQPVLSNDLFAEDHFSTDHIECARNSKLIVVYGATANFIGQLAAGLAADFMSTQILAYRGPVLMVPAMNTAMWENSIVKENVLKLKKHGFYFLGPVDGDLACGEVGAGHIAHNYAIEKEIEFLLSYSCMPHTRNTFSSKKILITAGPMRQDIDSVRFLKNRSSGLSGWGLARSLRELGAEVKVLLGPVTEPMRALFDGYDVTSYQSLEDYQIALESLWPWADWCFSLAAVLDFKLLTNGKEKISRNSLASSKLEIEKSTDFVRWMTSNKKAHQKMVSFSLEDTELADHDSFVKRVRSKMLKKHADFTVANHCRLGGPDDVNNNLWLFSSFDQEITKFEYASKVSLMPKLLDAISCNLIENSPERSSVSQNLV